MSYRAAALPSALPLSLASLALAALACASLPSAGCADGTAESDATGAASVVDGGTEGGVAVPGRDGGGGGGGGDGGTEEDSGGGNCTRRVVINEVKTSGQSSADDEFVELYNAGTCAVPLGDWKLPYRSKTGTGSAVLYTFPSGASIAKGAFMLIASSAFSGKKDGEFVANAHMADEGQVGLVDDTDKTVDALGFGLNTTGPFVEGDSAPKPPSGGGSVGRKQDGLDTGDNASDCRAFNDPTPGVSNE